MFHVEESSGQFFIANKPTSMAFRVFEGELFISLEFAFFMFSYFFAHIRTHACSEMHARKSLCAKNTENKRWMFACDVSNVIMIQSHTCFNIAREKIFVCKNAENKRWMFASDVSIVITM